MKAQLFRSPSLSLFVYTFSHFCVDFGCIFLLYRCVAPALSAGDGAAAFLLYSTIAFGLQLPIGALCDRAPRLPVGVAGCALVAVALGLMQAPYAALCACALGNALFHVGGGLDSLLHAKGRMARSGVFVSSGAIGVALGAWCGRGNISPMLPLALLLLCAGMILLCRVPQAGEPPRFGTDRQAPLRSPAWALLLLFIAILIRAYGGTLIPGAWKATYWLLPGVAACLGKAAGGLLADRIGARWAGAGALLLSIPLLAFFYKSPPLCALGILLFNMNMPVTLCAISDRLPGRAGLSFGLTTLALLCGSAPAFFFRLQAPSAIVLLPLLCLLSAGCILITIGKRR